MSTQWPQYFGEHTPWKNCNIRGKKSKNARKKIWEFIRRLTEDGFKSEGYRKRSLTGNTEEEIMKLEKRRRVSNEYGRRHYQRVKAAKNLSEEDQIELALSILEDFFPGARLWFTKVRPNMQQVS